MARFFLAGVLVVFYGVVTGADVTIVPLVDPTADPVHITNGWFDVEDPARPALVVELENQTAQPLSTAQVWLSTAMFFTKSERTTNGDRRVWTCGRMARGDGQPQVIPAGGKVSVKLAVLSGCQVDPQHAHFFVYVTQLSTGSRDDDALWKRAPADVARLLAAAMPHE